MQKIDLETSQISKLNDLLKDFQEPPNFYKNLQNKIEELEQRCDTECAQITSDIKSTQTFESQTEIRKEKFQIVNLIGIIYAIGIAIMSQLGDISHFILKLTISQ